MSYSQDKGSKDGNAGAKKLVERVVEMKAQYKQIIPTESEEQQALFEWAKIQTEHYPELKLLFAIPNGGKRHIVTALRMKKEGTRKGVPDLCLAVARGGYHGLYIELKRLNGGKVSEEQKKWIDALTAQVYKVEVCKGWQEASKVIMEYLEGIT